ncbi:hypothetical protein DSO57_1004628 [Entomophthora muscae]|uniref:Uncharacterized protein n=1 Tax=Entomophthora muscae TaxID=34485 RepID=A0ACC2SL86_9FUNG|nr:hypothetical protein DSO57_1004628 [Entomophthora muscae]
MDDDSLSHCDSAHSALSLLPSPNNNNDAKKTFTHTRTNSPATDKDQVTLDLEEKAYAKLSRLSQRDTSDTCKFVLAQFSALAFLKPEHTAQGFKFKTFLEYFKPQWIGKVVTQRQGKAHAKASWNMYRAAVNGELNTTLALEAYHKHLKANFGLHPKKRPSPSSEIFSTCPPTKPTTQSTLFTKAIQGVAKHKYKAS